MAGRYIPPHMRGSIDSSSGADHSMRTERRPEDGYTLEEISNQYSFDHKKQLGTLNRALKSVGEQEKHTLGFIIIFQGQHPTWPPKIFCKTNLYLLPRTDTLPSMWDDPLFTCPNMSHKNARPCPGEHTFFQRPTLILLICSLNETR